MIRAAREQPAPAVTVTVEDIRAEASGRTSMRWWGGLAAAAGVALSLWAFRSGGEETPAPASVAAVDGSVVEPPVQPRAAAADVGTSGPRMAASLSIEPLQGAEEARWAEGKAVSVDDGRYRIRTTEATTVSVAGRVLEVAAASLVVVEAGVEHSSFRVVKGHAAWVEPEPEPEPEPTPDAEPESPARRPGAKQLASRAEAALVSGRREEAVRLLRQLVKGYPTGAATKAGLIDLARLEQRLGRPDRAHCAYAMFVKRFPTDTRTPTVRRADDALGQAPRCRGLRPIAKSD